MEEIKQIGLNIWGLRGGYKSFCHSDNLNVNAPEILRTWLDIRDILYVSDLTVRFYALEFTSQYKVFTLYRPENDTGGRSGAYVATTLYVPHGVKINRTLDLMRQISDAYHNDHYDAFGNPNTNPDYIQVYLELIKNFAGNIVKEHDLRVWESSAQNNAPKIMPFTNISTVEQFFDKPYRKEFLNYQEVMFWDVDCLQNQQSHGVTFLKREILSTLLETDGSNIAPQFEGGAIKNVPSGCTIERFEREGVDITQNWQSCFFYDKTNVAITLKKPFHHPSLYQGSMIGIGSPFVKRGDDYDFGSRLDFQPRHYEIPVNVANVGNNSFDLYFGSQRVNISSGRGIFAFDGTQANGTCKVSIRPDGMTDFKVGDLIMNKFFASGSDETDPLQSYSIDSLKAFKFSFNQDCTGKLKLKYSSCNIDFSTSNKAYGIVLPAEKKAVDFQFEIDGYNAEIKTADNTTFEVTLTKQSFFVEVVVHQAIRPFVPSNSIQVKVGGKTYKGYRVTVPFADKNSNISLGIDLDGKGHFSNCECNISPNGDDVTLIPRLALLHNGLNQTLRQTLGNVTFEIPSNSTVAVPDNYEVNLHDNDDKYKVETEVESSGIKRTTISLKSMPVSETVNMGFGNNNSNDSNSNANSSYQSSYQPQSGKKTNKVIVGKYSYMGKVFTLDTDSKNYKNLGEGRYSVTIDERPCILCFVNSRPVPEMQEKHAAVNKKNGGFKVVYMDGQYYVESISHKRTGGNGGHGNNDKRKWFLWGGIGLGALLLIGGILWIILGRSHDKKPDFVIHIEMNNETQLKNTTVQLKGAGRDDESFKKVDNNTINLYENWAGVDIIIETDGEGTCEKITVSNDKTVSPKSSAFYMADTKNQDTMKIIVTSPVWMKIKEVESESNDSIAIVRYSEIAGEKNYSKYIREQVCVQKAFERVEKNKDNKTIINLFLEKFPNSSYDSECNTYLSDIASQEGAALQEAANWSNYEAQLNKVRSKNCSVQAINELKKAYESVKGDEKKLKDCNKKVTNFAGKSDWIVKEDGFCANHMKFMELFTTDIPKSYKSAMDLVNDLSGRTNTFDDDQRNLMLRFVNSEKIYNMIVSSPEKNKCKGQYYLLIEKLTN